MKFATPRLYQVPEKFGALKTERKAMITKEQRMQMKARKAKAMEAQTAEMLLLYLLLGPDSTFNRRNEKGKGEKK